MTWASVDNIPQITESWLKNRKACDSGIDYWRSVGSTNHQVLLLRCAKDNKALHGFWLCKKLMTFPQRCRWRNMAYVNGVDYVGLQRDFEIAIEILKENGRE